MILLYYSSQSKPERMLRPVRERLLEQARELRAQTIAVTVDPLPEKEWHERRLYERPERPSPANLFARVLVGLRGLPDDQTVYLCEDDVLYHMDHFRAHRHPELLAYVGIHPEMTFNYDLQCTHLCPQGFFDRHGRGAICLSAAWAAVGVARCCMERKLAEVVDGIFTCYEPAGSLGYPTNHLRMPHASIDIRHSANTTWTVDAGTIFREHEPGWPSAKELVRTYHIA